MNDTCIDNFLEFVKYDTQSKYQSDSYPSTEKQRVFGIDLVSKLKNIGLENAEIDQYGYVTATIESNTDKSIPVIGFLAHMDTSPNVSGKNVKPIIHKNYLGGDIVIAAEQNQILRFTQNSDLVNKIGHDIITPDGTTLLGADNKAGIAEIIDALGYLISHPEIEHGKIVFAIIPDEEISMGTKYFDFKKFGADFIYTIDGESIGEIEMENFNANIITITLKGVSVFPGFAKNVMVNSIKIASMIIDRLPKNKISPETTEKQEGFLHPYRITGECGETVVKFLVQDFNIEGLKQQEELIKGITEDVVSEYPKIKMKFEVNESYRNMKYSHDKNPKIMQYAIEAFRKSGIKPKKKMIRGCTYWARLSCSGIPILNLSSGVHNIHSKLEWISIQDMQKTVDVIVNLIKIWTEK